ncbi:MAG TPA: DUF167 domain-containing protein [Candidatus Sulfotelmatobacter sp.]|nr:DUF167 domain-containing protein [Candidatus Sulfotelmatobacter sp.]
MSDGVRFAARLTPRGGRDAVEAVTQDGALRVRVAAAPVDGAANEALIRLVAAELGVPSTDVRLVSGGRSRLKTIAVEHVTLGQVAARWPGLVAA